MKTILIIAQAFPAARRPGRPRAGVSAPALVALSALALAAAVASAGCGPAASPGKGTAGRAANHITAVAAENVWGSIVQQLGGSRISVTSISGDPNADPHDYQSSAGDARAFATADYVLLNGDGYDPWAQKLLDADQSSARTVTVVADVIGRSNAANPHFWYGPANIEKVADRVTGDLSTMDAADAGYFQEQRQVFERALGPYHDRIAMIKAAHAGTRIASTESIFADMADALGLDIISPPDFMKAVSESNDPPAQTVQAFQQQIAQRQVKVLVYNQQTSTAVTNNLRQLATQAGIPVVAITETIQPPDASFEDWQLGELTALQHGLAAGAPAA